MGGLEDVVKEEHVMEVEEGTNVLEGEIKALHYI